MYLVLVRSLRSDRSKVVGKGSWLSAWSHRETETGEVCGAGLEFDLSVTDSG
jgi:hypothetical protein